MKKLVILIFAILITTSVGLIVPILMNKQPGDIVNDISKVSDAVNTDEDTNTDKSSDQEDTDLSGTKGVNKIHITDKLNTPGVTQNSKVTLNNKSVKGNENDLNDSTKVISNNDEKDKQFGNSQNPNINDDKELVKDEVNDSQNPTTESIDPMVSATPVKVEPKSWIDKKLDEYKDDIDPVDIPDIKRIYSRIDVDYVQGLSEDGMTDEATNKIKEYLRKTLGSDYERAKELFYMYSYLI